MHHRSVPFVFVLVVLAIVAVVGRDSYVAVAAQNTTDGAKQKPRKVVIARDGTAWKLLVDSKPYFVKGAGGDKNLTLLRTNGGNSIRTWGVDDKTTPALLDNAHKNGLTVTLGIWLGHPQHGFRYDDSKMVADQLAKCREHVLRYRNHPALLAWGLGNEMEGDGKDPKVWRAIEDISKMVHELDPNHPTTTVIAEIGSDKAKNIAKYAPSVDILGVNSYGGLSTMPKRLAEQGWTKPYIVTEFGPRGPWEVGKTEWGAAIEESSTEKAKFYAANYKASVAGQPKCVGSYVFLWGDKMEGTHTWFGMFLPEENGGARLASVDALTEVWTGKSPKNRVPEIVRFGDEIVGRIFSRDQTQYKHDVPVTVRDPDGDLLRVWYEIRTEAVDNSKGTTFKAVDSTVHDDAPNYKRVSAGQVRAGHTFAINFAPTVSPGAYRLFVYVTDGKCGAAVANAPFYVGVPPVKPDAPKRP